jgi:hypothetical protein
VPAYLGPPLEHRELACPGREAALAAEVAELAKDRDERVAGALPGQVVQVGQGQMQELTAAAPDLKTSRAQQQIMQLADRRIPPGATREEPLNPRPGHLIGQAPGLR